MSLNRPELNYDPRVAAATAGVYERLKKVIPSIEWPVHAPYIDAINRLKKQRRAVILGAQLSNSRDLPRSCRSDR